MNICTSLLFTGHLRTGSEISSCTSAEDTEVDRLLKKMSEMTEILDARESKLVELSKSNLELQETNMDLSSQVKEAMKINAKLSEANVSSEEFTQRLATMEKKLQQTIGSKKIMYTLYHFSSLFTFIGYFFKLQLKETNTNQN